MSKLLDLIYSLRAFTILIIENEFSFVDNPKLILGNCCSLPKGSISQILSNLNKIGHNKLSDQLNEFIQNWNSIPNHDLAIFTEMGLDYPDLYLKKIGHEDIITEPIAILTDELKTDEDNIIKSVFLKNGIFIGEEVPKYRQILDQINSVTECRVIIRRDRPTEAQWIAFREEIESSMQQTNSNFCLSIIDKSLGGAANEGKEFIKDLINDHKDNEIYNHICCLYTSTALESSLENYEDYFVQEISKKNHENVIDLIAKVLAQSAYAEVFNSLRNKRIASTEDAFKLVLRNQKNIKYIIGESHNEGVPSYDAIKYWFDLAGQERFDERELKDFKFIAGLTAFFKSEYLDDHPKLSEIGENLRSLNTYELYDYHVNDKYLPIAPGDIWESNGKYFILMGQMCDLLLRKEKKGKPNQRNAKVGELIKVDITDIDANGKKYSIKTEENKHQIFIEHFKDVLDNDKIKALKIDISTPNICFSDLQVLDLSMYNERGKCEIHLNGTLDENVRLVLSEKKDEYFELLKSQYTHLGLKTIRALAGALDLNEPLDFSKLKFNESDGLISHGIRRVCRLKGRYYDSLYSNYLNAKGRLDLNLIDNAPDIVIPVSIKFQLANNVETLREEVVNLCQNRGGKYFVKSEIEAKVGEPFVTLLKIHKNRTIDFTETHALLLTENEGHILIQFLYQTMNNKPIPLDKKVLDFRSIFLEKKDRYANRIYKIGEEERKFKESPVTIEELETGIIIEDLGERVIFKGGILTIEKIEE